MQACPVSAPSVDPANLNTPCPRTEVVFRRTTSGYVRIYFLKRSMNAEVIAKYFQHDYFRIDDGFELPPAIVHGLGLTDRQVGAGFYKMRSCRNFFIIDLAPDMRKSTG